MQTMPHDGPGTLVYCVPNVMMWSHALPIGSESPQTGTPNTHGVGNFF